MINTHNWDHTNPPHPHHHPFNKFKLEFIKCNNSLNARNTELSSLQSKSFEFIKSDVWGWGGLVWPLCNAVRIARPGICVATGAIPGEVASLLCADTTRTTRLQRRKPPSRPRRRVLSPRCGWGGT